MLSRNTRLWWIGPTIVLSACTDDIASPPPPDTAGSGGSATAGSGGGSGTNGASGSSGSAASAGISGSGGAAATGGAAGTLGSGGAAGTTGGTAGGAGTGAAGTGGGAGPCGAAGVIVCDTFEDTAVGAPADSAKWSAVGDPTIAPRVVDTKKRSGTRSLHFPSTNNRGVFVAAAMGLPRPDKRFYARAYLNFTQPMSELGGHVAFIVAASLPENGVEVRLGASKTFGGTQQAMLDLNFIGSGQEHTQFSNGDYTGGNGSSRPGVVFDADRWYCVETLFDGAAHELRVWVDEVEVPGLHVSDWGVQRANWSPEYNVIKFGAQNYSGSLGAVHYDDIAVGTGPIGCN